MQSMSSDLSDVLNLVVNLLQPYLNIIHQCTYKAYYLYMHIYDDSTTTTTNNSSCHVIAK